LSLYAQGDLFAVGDDPQPDDAVEDAPAEEVPEPVTAEARWWPGQDVRHDELGPGWVWGRGLGRVTVRFEGPLTPPGPVRTLASDDPALHPAEPPDWRVSEPAPAT
jgi:DNA polymerase-4